MIEKEGEMIEMIASIRGRRKNIVKMKAIFT